jgi:hypothetical protein
MSTVIEAFDRVTAAGILARAALAVENEANPAAQPTLPDEASIRAKVIEEISKRYGIASVDNQESREKLCDALDQISDELLGPVDTDIALERLAKKGDLPSDLYEVEIIPNIEQFYGKKFAREKQLIEETVHLPDLEQHYGPPKNPHDPYLISIFAKTFHDEYPARSFIMLIAGERKNLTMIVYQAWRLYPEDLDLTGASSPLDMLKRFALVFGTDLTVGNQHGSFILIGDVPDGKGVLIQGRVPQGPMGKSIKRQFTFSYFRQARPGIGGHHAALMVGIDLDKYREALESHGW